MIQFNLVYGKKCNKVSYPNQRSNLYMASVKNYLILLLS